MLSKLARLATDIHEHLAQHEAKELLRFVTVGSVDDGKSTLIGRLLHDTEGVYEDQLSAVERASQQRGGELDLALLTDGLKAEREQGITIDVAYRYFTTEKRKFIIADTPGHIQYTRNMATGASTANAAVILIDARHGVLQQSRRHAYIAALLAIPHLLVCVNKMDAVDFARARFEELRDEVSTLAAQLGFKDCHAFPVSALCGDNVVHRSSRMPWYSGPTLLHYLETVPIADDRNLDDWRFPVQCVLRPDSNYRGYAGTVASGIVRKGDRVMALPSGKETRIVAIDTFDGELEEAFAPMSIALRLKDELDISRGDMLVHPQATPRAQRRFQANLVWLGEQPLDRQKSYLLKHTSQKVRAEVEAVEAAIDLDTLEEHPTQEVALNDIVRVSLSCHHAIFFDAYEKNRTAGAFILVDSFSNATVAAGMIIEQREAPQTGAVTVLPRSQVSDRERRDKLGHAGAAILLTGLPGSGKSVLAYALERRLFDRGCLAAVIDPEDAHGSRNRLPTHAAELAFRMSEAGVLTIFAHCSPRAEERAALRDAVGSERFLEVHVTPPNPVPASSHGYDFPREPAASISLGREAPESRVESVILALEQRGLIPR